LLTHLILGMNPIKVWTGMYDTEASNLNEREKATFLSNRSQFEDYLFANTKLETASSTKHDFGKVYEENGNFYFKLNLQIRFK
jgi:HpaII restriction endonuclease